MGRDAIIVTDMQNAFMTKDNKILGSKIKKHLEKKRYDFILFSQFINTNTSNFVKKLHWQKCKERPEVEIIESLSDLASKNHIFKKQTYSIFKSKECLRFLRKNKISRVFLCGVDADACILASAFDAFDLGFDVTILEDLTRSSGGKEVRESAKKIIKRNLKS